MASNEEMEEGLRNLSQYNNEVDFIISHCCATSTQKQFVDKTFFSRFHDGLSGVSEAAGRILRSGSLVIIMIIRILNQKEILIYEQIIRIL